MLSELDYRLQRSESVRKHYTSLSVGVLLPLLQAFITAILLGVVVGATAYYRDLAAFKLAFLAFAYSLFLMWLWLLAKWLNIVSHLEQLTGIDINRDGMIADDPDPENQVITRLEIVKDEGRSTSFLDLPATPEELAKLAQGVLEGRALTESNWVGSRNLFTRARFSELRDKLIKRGVLCWNSPGTPARGVTLTRPGKAVFQHLASNSPAFTHGGK